MKWPYIIIAFVFLLVVTTLELYHRYQIYLLNTKLVNLAALQKEKRELDLKKMNLIYETKDDNSTLSMENRSALLTHIIVMPKVSLPKQNSGAP